MTSKSSKLQRDQINPESAKFRMVEWPFYWLARVNRMYENDLDTLLKKIDLDVARWRVLMMLHHEKVASISELADHGALKLSTMTKTVQRLRRDNMVLTRTREADARVTEVVLTTDGEEAVTQISKLAGRVYQSAFDGFETHEIEQLNAVLRRLYTNLNIAF